MAELSIVIPSYKRWENLPGYDYFSTAKYIIPESQYNNYAFNRDKKRFIAIPDSEDGNIVKKRNWILKNIPRPLIMIDDDVTSLMMTDGKADDYFERMGIAKERVKLTPEQAIGIFEQTANLAYQWECPMFGFNLNTDGRNYQQYKPFSLTQPILGPCSGHLFHDLLYDEKMDLKEDYDISIQALNKYRKILRLNKYAVDADHKSNKGGCVSYRTLEREEAACKAIEKKWGTHIIHYNIEKGKYTSYLNGIVHIPINGV
jgi:hypothetical protein